MKQAVFAYTFGNAVHRGVVWLTLLLLAGFLSKADVGVYALAQTVATLLTPMVVLNGAAAILREGVNHPNTADELLRRFGLIGGGITTALCLAAWFFPVAGWEWMMPAILLAAASGILNLVLAHLQAANRYWIYFWHCVIKACLVSASIVIAARNGMSGTELLILQTMFLLLHSCGILIGTLLRVRAPDAVTLGPILAFTLPLLPYSAAQWIMSSSDRMILKGMIDDAAVGAYSIAYAMSAGLVLFNAGIGTALPRYASGNFDRWSERRTRVTVLLSYSLIAVVAVVATLFGIHVLATHTTLLAKYDVDLLRRITLWVLAGQFCLGLYQIYATYLFYHRRSGLLATQTICGAATNVVLTVILVSKFGIVGAAMATFVGYLTYLALVVAALGQVEQRLRRAAMQESVAIASFCSVLGTAVFLTQRFLI